MTEIIVKSYFFAALCEVAKTRNGNVTFISFCSLLLTFFERRKNEECKEVKIDVKSTYNLAKLLGSDMMRFFSDHQFFCVLGIAAEVFSLNKNIPYDLPRL